MIFKKLKSWVKLNLSLNVIKRLPNNYHQIESIITFAQFSDEIKIKKISKCKSPLHYVKNKVINKKL